MPKPVTPLCGCDVFVTDAEHRVLLIQRSDNDLWALPGGCQNLGDTPQECAARECFEETGYTVKITSLLGVWSSLKYPYVHYPYKENVFTHLLFTAEIIGGSPRLSEESKSVGWFDKTEIPSLSDGHSIRLEFAFEHLNNPELRPHFE